MKKYYLVHVANAATGEVWEATRWDVSPNKALSRVLKGIKFLYSAEEYEQAIFRCKVNRLVEADIERLKAEYIKTECE